MPHGQGLMYAWPASCSLASRTTPEGVKLAS
jgi:hypothetical protein